MKIKSLGGMLLLTTFSKVMNDWSLKIPCAPVRTLKTAYFIENVRK